MITVLGLDGSALSPLAQSRLDRAVLILGGQRHLAEVTVPAGTTTVALRENVGQALQQVLDAEGDVVVLASGDPGLFGVLRLLRERLPADAVEVLPAVSSVSLAFARAGLPWDDAIVVSAHGRELRPAVAVCRAHPKVAVLTAHGSGPSELGAALRGTGRRLFVAERLGLAGERTTWTTPEQAANQQWDPLNVVLVLDQDRSVATSKGWLLGRQQPAGWALPDDAFAHRAGMLTKAEVRALALARLGPRLGDLIWDIGAGSGAVGVECARLGAAVIAVEKGDPTFIQTNARTFGVDIQIVTGAAPTVLPDLPDPDAVFIGGGGADVGQIVRHCVARGPRIIVVALAAVDRLSTVQAALAPYAVEGVLLQANRLRDLAGATALAATNPVFLIWGNRT